MRKIPAALFLVLLLSVWCRAGDRPLLAHGDGKGLWVAVRVPTAVGPTTAPEPGDTRVFVRPPGIGQPWTPFGTIGGGVRSISSFQGQVVAVLDDGSWMTLWDGGSASGAQGPGGGRVMALAESSGDRERSLWALASVPGGITAAREAIERDAGGDPAAPTTQVTAQVASQATTQAGILATTRSSAEKAVLFQQLDGRWIPRAQMPDSVPGNSTDVPASLWAGNDRAVVALRDGHNTVRLWSWDAKSGWKPALDTAKDLTGNKPFGLLPGPTPSLWLATGPCSIEVLTDLNHPDQKTTLIWSDAKPSTADPAVVCQDTTYRVFTVVDGKSVIEHDFNKADGRHLPGDSELPLTLNGPEMPGQIWLEAVLLAVLTFTTAAVGYRQITRMRQPETIPAKPPTPAPLTRRLMAGLFDLSPVLLVVIVVSGLRSAPNWSPGDWFAVGGAFVFYWIWVSLFEVLTGRSLGKTMLGLRVVTIAGNPVSQVQLVVRNLLRPIDPLLLIVVSPLGQRTADVIADTMVIAEEEPEADGPSQE